MRKAVGYMSINKSDIRKQIKTLRAQLTPDEVRSKSARIAEDLLALPEYKGADVVCTYVSFGHEVDTSQIIDRALADGRTVCVPKVYGKDMHFIRICSRDELAPGSYGIYEPVSDEICDSDEGLMLMPGVAFDRSGNRVGYGGGYYDRYLARHGKLMTIALAYDFQIVDEICAEPTDIKPQMIITDAAVDNVMHTALHCY